MASTVKSAKESAKVFQKELNRQGRIIAISNGNLGQKVIFAVACAYCFVSISFIIYSFLYEARSLAMGGVVFGLLVASLFVFAGLCELEDKIKRYCYKESGKIYRTKFGYCNFLRQF